MEPALHEQRPLEAEGSDEEVEAHSAEAVLLQKRHQEAKSNKDHDVDILETWNEDDEEEDKTSDKSVLLTKVKINVTFAEQSAGS